MKYSVSVVIGGSVDPRKARAFERVLINNGFQVYLENRMTQEVKIVGKLIIGPSLQVDTIKAIYNGDCLPEKSILTKIMNCPFVSAYSITKLSD